MSFVSVFRAKHIDYVGSFYTACCAAGRLFFFKTQQVILL